MDQYIVGEMEAMKCNFVGFLKQRMDEKIDSGRKGVYENCLKRDTPWKGRPGFPTVER